jgi:hypothetical protein
VQVIAWGRICSFSPFFYILCLFSLLFAAALPVVVLVAFFVAV